ncbi:hypothetical protein [Streptomyces sp. NPDC051310]|uniref:hypothetical protein n=1 Tax=Streptomyces sp. NPDC051310 TaxID=3365649 RepID=UPI003792F4DF
MGRRRHRRLVAGSERYRWWVGHQHVTDAGPDDPPGRSRACREVLAVVREGSPGVVRVVFASGPGRVVGGGGWGAHEGGVSRDRGYLNLHRPATVRAVIDELVAQGRPFGSHAVDVDGWRLFDAVLGRLRPEGGREAHGERPSP